MTVDDVMPGTHPLAVDDGLAEMLLWLEALVARADAAIVPVLHDGIDESEVVTFLDGVGLNPTSEVIT